MKWCFLSEINVHVCNAYKLSRDCFVGDKVPKDNFAHERTFAPPSIVCFVVVIVLGLLGTSLSVGFLFFNLYYRNNRYLHIYVMI